MNLGSLFPGADQIVRTAEPVAQQKIKTIRFEWSRHGSIATDAVWVVDEKTPGAPTLANGPEDLSRRRRYRLGLKGKAEAIDIGGDRIWIPLHVERNLSQRLQRRSVPFTLARPVSI